MSGLERTLGGQRQDSPCPPGVGGPWGGPEDTCKAGLTSHMPTYKERVGFRYFPFPTRTLMLIHNQPVTFVQNK